MLCVYCGGDTQVINSRLQKRVNNVWRRRKCPGCGAIFSTTESPDASQALTIRKDKQLSPFVRDNLFISVYDSLKHRKDALNEATALTATIVSNLYPLAEAAVIDRAVVVTITSTILGRYDKVAATHYAAFHPL
jgi:transcriptional repressor NrdR